MLTPRALHSKIFFLGIRAEVAMAVTLFGAGLCAWALIGHPGQMVSDLGITLAFAPLTLERYGPRLLGRPETPAPLGSRIPVRYPGDSPARPLLAPVHQSRPATTCRRVSLIGSRGEAGSRAGAVSRSEARSRCPRADA